MIRGMVEVLSCSLMETGFKENTNLEKLMVRAVTLGKMAKLTKVNGSQARNVVMVSGEACKVILILASGRTTKQRATVSTLGSKETGMRASGASASDTVRVLISSLMATSTSGST